MLHVVVFDGYCHVCSGSVRYMLTRRIDPPFEVLPMTSERGRALLLEHGIDPEDPMTFLVLDDGRAFTQSDGVLQVTKALGGSWRAFAVAGRIVPKFVRDWLYRVLARNRYKWFGKRSTCYLSEVK